MQKSAVNVAYCFDRNYAPFAAVSSYSLLKNSRSDVRLHWCVEEADFGFASDVAGYLAGKVSANLTVVRLDAERLSHWRTTTYFTTAAFYRLLLPDVLKEDKVIYIDCDTIVQRDLSDLYGADMKGNPLCGVVDRWGTLQHQMPISRDDPYINTGVLLLDLGSLREDNFFHKCREIYELYADKLRFVDQCIINKYAEGRKTLVSPTWNRMIACGSRLPAHFANLTQDNVLHFYTSTKPWHDSSNRQMAALWQSCAAELDLPAQWLTAGI